MLVLALTRRLPPRFTAEPRVHLGALAEIDVASFAEEGSSWTSGPSAPTTGNGAGGAATALATWTAAPPTLALDTNVPETAEYAVQVYDEEAGRRLVAAVEIVSPANKDRPEHRRAFVAKCAALLQQQVAVTIVDVVTTRHFNLYGDLLALFGLADPALGTEPQGTYAVTCRDRQRQPVGRVEAWYHPLAVGQPLPTLPLWLAEDLAVPLELEATYEETCRALRLP
jgi:hypothetical protein